MKGKKKYSVIIIVLMLVAVLYGYYLYNMPVASIANQSPDYILSPSELISAYESNEQEANNKYLGKILQIEGQIDKIEIPKTLYMRTESPLSSVIFELEDSLALNLLGEGENITLKGVCTGYLMDVVLNRVVIIDNN